MNNFHQWSYGHKGNAEANSNPLLKTG